MQMMQNLDVISVNVWQIAISLCNLVLIFLILKKFLYKPVRKVLAQRQEAVDAQYREANRAEREANELKRQWDEQMAGAEEKADTIVKQATESAEQQSRAILDETKEKAERMLRQAEADAALERKKAEAGIRKEIVDVSAALSEKMIGRELNPDDHHALIDSFLSELGEDNDGNK